MAGRDGPHPGTLEIWEDSGGGPPEVDPSVCYYTVCAEPISNVYETLIAYNGSQDGGAPSDLVPELATCVPGSGECAAQFGGNDLVWDNNTTGAPQFYTFEIDAGARFYDPTTTVGWSVYPSDVVFSFARTMGFADLPYEEATPGWINTQDLVPAGTSNWDGGIHYPLNNTPQHILSAFLINDSNYCPTSTIVVTHGCVTFDVGPSGKAWPFFLQLVGSPWGASIEPCGLYTYLGAKVPGFSGTNASDGDGPCLLPGNSTSSQDPGYTGYVATTPFTGWDAFEQEALNIPAVQPSVQWTEVGSGPYYALNPINPSVGYTLYANPDYHAPAGCTGEPGCLPIAGHYIPNVDVVWGPSGDAVSLDELCTGQADSGGFNEADTDIVLSCPTQLVGGIPSLTTFFDPINFNISLKEYAQQDTDPINIPSNFFQNVALRNFLVNAYPYAGGVSIYNVYDGIAYGEPYGGAIPHDMGDYYPTNISWPSGNPVANVTSPGNVAWWWEQARNASGPWYDPQLANCTASTPCTWDMWGVIGDTVLDGEYALWNAAIKNLSGGALNPGINDVSGPGVLQNIASPPGGNPMPVYSFGWAADYPDPTDFAAPMYYPDNSYTSPDSVSEILQSAPNNASSCPHNYGAWSNLAYWANVGEVPTDCQGAAYDTMVAWMDLAATESNLTYRVLEYNLVEHIANELALYMYDYQSVTWVAVADWIEPSTVNTNPMIGGSGVQLWYEWGYVSNYFNVSFSSLGLPSGTDWGVTMNGVGQESGNGSTITFRGLTNRSYGYAIGTVTGFVAIPSVGNVTVSGTDVRVVVVFRSTYGPVLFPVGFSETGLPSGTTWGLDVNGTEGEMALHGAAPVLWTNLTNGTYSYTPNPLTGYGTPAAGQFTVAGVGENVTVGYSGVCFGCGPNVAFNEDGLPEGSEWAVTVNGTVFTATTSAIQTRLGNGTYSWGLVSWPPGYVGIPNAGTFAVTGGVAEVSIVFGPLASSHYSPTISATYLGGLAWTLIATLALLAVILLSIAVLGRGRRPPPPEAWSPPTPPA